MYYFSDSFPRKFPNGPMISLSVPRLYFRSAVNNKRQSDDELDGIGAAPANSSTAVRTIIQYFKD
jgi:hypothetical protein